MKFQMAYSSELACRKRTTSDCSVNTLTSHSHDHIRNTFLLLDAPLTSAEALHVLVRYFHGLCSKENHCGIYSDKIHVRLLEFFSNFERRWLAKLTAGFWLFADREILQL